MDRGNVTIDGMMCVCRRPCASYISAANGVDSYMQKLNEIKELH